jgi:hypothetical protein
MCPSNWDNFVPVILLKWSLACFHAPSMRFVLTSITSPVSLFTRDDIPIHWGGSTHTSRHYILYSLGQCLWIIGSSDWLIDYLRFYVPLKNISLVWRRHHYRWRAAKFRPMLGAQGLWAGRDLYRATPAVTRGLGFSGLIRRTAPFSRLLRHARPQSGLPRGIVWWYWFFFAPFHTPRSARKSIY